MQILQKSDPVEVVPNSSFAFCTGALWLPRVREEGEATEAARA